MISDISCELSTLHGGAWLTLMPCRGPPLAASCSAAVCWSLTSAGKCALWILKISLYSLGTLMGAKCVRSVTICCHAGAMAISSRCAPSSLSHRNTQQQLNGSNFPRLYPCVLPGRSKGRLRKVVQAQKIALSRPPMRCQTWRGAGHLDRTKLGERFSPSILALKACCHPVDAV